jgi:hypothetical protein
MVPESWPLDDEELEGFIDLFLDGTDHHGVKRGKAVGLASIISPHVVAMTEASVNAMDFARYKKVNLKVIDKIKTEAGILETDTQAEKLQKLQNRFGLGLISDIQDYIAKKSNEHNHNEFVEYWIYELAVFCTCNESHSCSS